MPLTEPEKLTAVVAVPLHNVWLAGADTVGVGVTVIVKVCAVPVQPLTDGVTVIMPDIANNPLLVAVNAAILPEPDAPRPMLVLELAHV